MLPLFLCLSQDAFVDLYDRQRDSLFSCSWPSIKTVFGLAAIGAAGLTIGAYLTQKWTSPHSSKLNFISHPRPPSFFPFKDASDPPETTSRLFSIWLASKPPLRNSLFLAPPCQNRHISKQLKEPDAGPRQSRGSLGRRDVITQSRVQLREKEESMACVVILFCSACFCTRYSMNVGC